MDTVTYPNEAIVTFINQNVIPLRISASTEPMSSDFAIKWTPALLVLDQYGKEHHRMIGFLGPEELIPSLMLGIGKLHYNREEFSDAIQSLEKLMISYPETDMAAEAIFLTGICLYKSTHSPAPLKQAYEQLQSKYPGSTWTQKAYPYRLL